MATKTRARGPDPEVLTSRLFAEMLQAFMECCKEVQDSIKEMAGIVNDPEATDAERQMACSTIAEALFPTRHGKHLGFDLEAYDRCNTGDDVEHRAAMDRQEATFADRVSRLMAERGLTQKHLAEAVGVGQPAISMMLSRKARPQRATAEKIALALGVPVSELWPEA